MTRLTALALVAFALTACDGKSTTTVSQTTNVNGAVTSKGVEISDYAMRAALGTNPNTAAYVTIKNTGDAADRLVSASCECAEKTELHTMSMKDGMMDMAPAPDGFVIAPGESVVLKPGSNHIMLLGLKVRPTEGSTVNLKLTFEKAGEVTLAMPVSNAPLVQSGAADEHAGMKM